MPINIAIVHDGTPAQQREYVLKLAREANPRLAADFEPDNMEVVAAGVFRKMVEKHNLLAAYNFHIPPTHTLVPALMLSYSRACVPVILAVQEGFRLPDEWKYYVDYYRITPAAVPGVL